MTSFRLKKLLAREKGVGGLLTGLFAALDEPLAILDDEGQLIMGALPSPDTPRKERFVRHHESVAGMAVGGVDSPWPSRLTALLGYLLEQEDEKKALAGEVLDKYRELHLLYRLSEKLANLPRPEAIARLALEEAAPLIQVTGGVALLKSDADEQLTVLAAHGDTPALRDPSVPAGLIARVLQNGAAELENQAPAEQYFSQAQGGSVSLLCAPLKSESGVFGVILMICARERQFTAGELKLLAAIAAQTSPAIEIARLHQMKLEQARLERDLQVARQVQAGLLPRHTPEMPGWQVAAFWQPAQAVGGDFYDFISFPDGRLGLVIADVANKGVPSALVMANTRSILRAVAASAAPDCCESPAKVLTQVNDILCDDMPPHMFVTCQLFLLDPHSGRISYTNAGHNLPYLHAAGCARELYATGMPLGIFPGVSYDDYEITLQPGESLLLYSDGLVEAHNPQGEMFGNQRLENCLAATHASGAELIVTLMRLLGEFTGSAWEQEDDVTFVSLQRLENRL